MRLLAFLVLISGMAAAQPPALAYGNKDRQTVRLYIFTASSAKGLVDSNLSDTVKDLKKYLSKYTLVDNQNNADVCVEVVGRGYVPTGTVSTVTQGLSTTTGPNTVAAIRVTLTAGDYSTTIDGVGVISNFFPNGTWRSAAVAVEAQIDKWIRGNYDKLLALRTK